VAQMTDPDKLALLTAWIWLLTFAVNIAYFTYFHGSTGRTPGKRPLGLQVVSVTGESISFGTAFLRSVGYLVSSLVFCLGYLWVAFDRRKQGWHDKIAGTVVIIREPRGNESGISIPDSSSGPQSPAGFGCVPVNVSQPEENKPDAPSVQGASGVDGQKMP
ncbi:MAG: RDD family protein, partial [Smithellaceae bacterium]